MNEIVVCYVVWRLCCLLFFKNIEKRLVAFVDIPSPIYKYQNNCRNGNPFCFKMCFKFYVNFV